MDLRFVLKQDAGGSYRFHLVGTDGQVIASSHAYPDKASAQQGITSVQQHAAHAETDDQTTRP